MAPLKLASGCDRRCSFCAIPSFRGSFVSRRPSDVIQEGRVARRAGRQGAVPGQRELHVLRQGPRRPPAARDAAARAGRDRRRRAGAGVLPAARRDPARPDRGDRRHAGRGALLRPLLPARVSATVLRRMRRFGDPDSFLDLLERIRDLAPRGRRPVERHRRLPRRDRGRPRRPSATSSRRPGSTSPASSATPTRTAPRRRRTTASSTRTRSASAPSGSPRWSRSSTPSGPRSGSARPSTYSSSRSTDGRTPRVAPTTRVRRSTVRRPLTGVRSGGDQVGDLVRADGDRHRRCRPDRHDAQPTRARCSDDRHPGQGQQLERPQRADHAAHRDGAVLRLRAAARRRRLDHLAAGRVRRSSSAR